MRYISAILAYSTLKLAYLLFLRSTLVSSTVCFLLSVGNIFAISALGNAATIIISSIPYLLLVPLRPFIVRMVGLIPKYSCIRGRIRLSHSGRLNDGFLSFFAFLSSATDNASGLTRVSISSSNPPSTSSKLISLVMSVGIFSTTGFLNLGST